MDWKLKFKEEFIMNKIKNWLIGVSAWIMVFIMNTHVLATITEVSADELANTFATTIKGLLIPLGIILIIVAVTIAAVKIITSANKPQERTDAVSSLPWILLGAGLLGGVMIVAGFLMGIMTQLGA